MRHFVFLFLFVFSPGNTLLNLSQDCGGKILGEKRGSIRYTLPPNNSEEKLLDITCIWIIDAHENQTVWIDAISVGKGARIGITFGNGDTVIYEKEKRVLFSGIGRTIVEWSLKSTDKTFASLNLRWNTSEESHTPALIPYTHSDADPVSPSPSGSNGVTYTPDIPVDSNETPKTHTVRGKSIRRGGGVSDLTNNHRPHYPQETTNNGQETAGVWISDLAFTDTHSFSDTHTSSALDTHMNTLTVLSDEPSEIQRTTPRQATDYGVKTSTDLYTAFTEESSQPTHAFTTKRVDLSSSFPAANTQNILLFAQTSTHTNILDDSSDQDSSPTMTLPNRDEFTISDNIGMTRYHTNTITDENEYLASETDRTDRSPRSTNPNINNQTANDDSLITTSTPKLPNANQTNHFVFSESGMTEYSTSKTQINVTTIFEPTFSTSSQSPLTTLTALTTESHLTSTESRLTSILTTSETLPPLTTESHLTSTQEANSLSAVSDITTLNNNKISVFTSSSTTIHPDLTPTESPSTPEADDERSPSGNDCLGLECTSYFTSTVREEQETSPPSISSSSASPRIHPNMTSDSTTVGFVEESEATPSEVQNTNTKSTTHAEVSIYTSTPHYLHPSSNTVGFSDVTYDKMKSGQTESTSQATVTSLKPTLGSSPFNDVHTGSTESAGGFTSQTSITTPSISQLSTNDGIQSSIIDSMTGSQTSMVLPASITTIQTNLHTMSAETTSVWPQTSTVRPLQHTTTSSYVIQTKVHEIPTQTVTHYSSTSFDKKWPHGRHYFIVEDQPVNFKEKTFQVLLQIVLEGDNVPSLRLLEVETFLRKIAGFQNQHVTWHSGPVLQTVVQFQTEKALSWLGRVESLLQEAELNPLPKKGIFVGGVRVKNITVGGLQTDACEWLFECPSGFQCVSSKGNATCTSVCHSEYCKHQGICVHRLGLEPLCQCPVGEDYWFMGQRCDLRMTRPRLVGVCFGVLVAVAAVMAFLSYLAVRRFKSMLMQAKVEQTRSSYRRFNHFDELSARFWGRSWPGSEDSLDNPGFTRSDELLHLRALDRTCCYHDDTLSVVSTYHGSGAHLNTVYPHGSQYGWDISNCSLADGVVDSGKASDLSVCSWPIEPIQWTPFPLLQQLSRNTTTVKASRPRSYCEGMELVDLEKSWTA